MAKIRKSGIDEGGVYRCSWSKRGCHYTLTCLLPVKVQSVHRDFVQAKEILLGKIMELTGDGEPSLAFNPLPPKIANNKSLFKPEYFWIGFQEFVDWHADPGQLFELGVCKKCGAGLGKRNKNRRILHSIPRYDIAGFRLDKNASWMLSEQVADQLKPFVPQDWLVPVENANNLVGKKVKKFFEVAFSPLIEQIIPKENENLTGWKCPKCQTQVILFTAKTLVPEKAIFIPRNIVRSKVLLISSGPFLGIAIDKDLNLKISKDKNIKGFVSRRVAFLDPGQAMGKNDIANIALSSP